MIIGCTKKLQNEVEITAEYNNEANDLYSWSANLITIRRRKAVVVVNDSNRFGFVLYGLKAKDFKMIDKLIIDGIRTSLKKEKIKEEIIEQYMSEASKMSFCKTKGPKYVARLNKACQIAGFNEEILDLDNIYQFEVTKVINSDYIKVGKKEEYEHPYDLLMKDFKEVYGQDIVKCEAVDLMIKLDLGNYTAERRIIIPIDINFEQLHNIVQIAFDWKDYHLYEFNIINDSGERVLNIISEHEEVFEVNNKCKVALDYEVSVSDYIKGGFKILYCYDFGDNWQHEIIMQGIIDNYDKNYPICLEAVGDTPPEDVGGVPGYEEFLKIMASPDDPEYEHTKSWAISSLYRKFDMELVNGRLEYVLRR